MDKSYKRAIELLNQRRRPPRSYIEPSKSFSGLSQIPISNEKSDLKGIPSISGMREWLNELGHSTTNINRLNVIHVAGTKGKGSTCAFVDTFLRAYGERTGFPRKVGLYTSPHLLHPEERIRINFQPLSRDLFAKYFFEVDDILTHRRPRELETRPRYLQFFALLSFHTFIREGVDAAIFETHHGGEFDSTNVVEKPVVTAVTTLGIDHINQLGSSIESIAWHKAGVFKPGARAVTAPQEDDAATEVMRARASEKGISLRVVDADPSLGADIVQLKPNVQRTNCSVALAAVRSFIEKMDKASSLSASDIHQGLSQFSWPGRFQLVIEDQFQWFLDSAHNEMSVGMAAEWFLETSAMQKITSPVVRVLIFSLITDQRDGNAVFERLASSLIGGRIQYVIFTTYERDSDSRSENDPQQETWKTISEDQHVYADIWRAQHDTNILFEPTIQGALETVRKLSEDRGSIQTLITGSQHLVGGALSLIQASKESE